MSVVMILKSISKKSSTTRRNNDIDGMNDKERNVYILMTEEKKIDRVQRKNERKN